MPKTSPSDMEVGPKDESCKVPNSSTTESPTIIVTGHVQELSQKFSLWSLAGTGILVGNVWPALGGSILVAIYNGGPPGVIYEFIAASCFYFVVAASLAELASAMPSSAGPYLWASVTPGKRYGPVVGFFSGYWNALAWVFAAASMSSISANLIVHMYAVSHGAFRVHAWHVFVTYLLVTWLACAAVCLFDKWMPMLNKVGIFVTVTGLLVTITVCAVGPSRHGELGHASNATVWTGWTADIGYPDGFAFALGMLNAAYAMGTPDSTSHLAEEILNPSRNVPKAMAMQYVIGFISGLAYLITILYAINDLDALLVSAYPIAEIYHQATGSSSGTIGLLFLLLLPTLICVISVYLTCGRTIWALARDGATPFPKALSKVDPKLRVPAIATLTCCALASVMGCIYVGSSTAFNAFVGSFVLMSSSSYIASLLPLLLRGRKGIRFGCFRLNSLGFPLNVVSCGYLITWFVIYCFPYSLPTSAKSMNYSCLIWGGLTILIALWWIVHARYHYPGISVPASQVAVL